MDVPDAARVEQDNPVHVTFCNVLAPPTFKKLVVASDVQLIFPMFTSLKMAVFVTVNESTISAVNIPSSDAIVPSTLRSLRIEQLLVTVKFVHPSVPNVIDPVAVISPLIIASSTVIFPNTLSPSTVKLPFITALPLLLMEVHMIGPVFNDVEDRVDVVVEPSVVAPLTVNALPTDNDPDKVDEMAVTFCNVVCPVTVSVPALTFVNEHVTEDRDVELRDDADTYPDAVTFVHVKLDIDVFASVVAPETVNDVTDVFVPEIELETREFTFAIPDEVKLPDRDSVVPTISSRSDVPVTDNALLTVR